MGIILILINVFAFLFYYKSLCPGTASVMVKRGDDESTLSVCSVRSQQLVIALPLCFCQRFSGANPNSLARSSRGSLAYSLLAL